MCSIGVFVKVFGLVFFEEIGGFDFRGGVMGKFGVEVDDMLYVDGIGVGINGLVFFVS